MEAKTIVVALLALGFLVVARALWKQRAGSAGDEDKAEDPFVPRLLEVVPRPSDELEAVFRRAFDEPAELAVVVVTPERKLLFPGVHPLPPLAGARALAERQHPFDVKAFAAQFVGNAENGRIAAISYTDPAALTEDPSYTRCIPFLGLLLAFGAAGHRVVVFEGDEMALPAALKTQSGRGRAGKKLEAQSVDVLFVDDAMIPFLAEDWRQLVRASLAPSAKVFIHRRSDFELVEVRDEAVAAAPARPASDLERHKAYIDGLLTTLARNPGTTVTLTTKHPPPSLEDLATDAAQLAYVSALPCAGWTAAVDATIGMLLGLARYPTPNDPRIKTVLHLDLAAPDDTLEKVSFELSMTHSDGVRTLEVTSLRR